VGAGRYRGVGLGAVGAGDYLAADVFDMKKPRRAFRRGSISGHRPGI
jgi:hypothetical protein